MNCESCGKEVEILICSRFSDAMICNPCNIKEIEHPDFEKLVKDNNK